MFTHFGLTSTQDTLGYINRLSEAEVGGGGAHVEGEGAMNDGEGVGGHVPDREGTGRHCEGHDGALTGGQGDL